MATSETPTTPPTVIITPMGPTLKSKILSFISPYKLIYYGYQHQYIALFLITLLVIVIIAIIVFAVKRKNKTTVSPVM
jgi:hypothetical protein